MRIALNALLIREPKDTLVEVTATGVLLPEDLSNIEKELLPFDAAVLMSLFVDYFGAHTDIEFTKLGEHFGFAIVAALHDIGTPDAALEAQGNELMSSAFAYLAAADAVTSRRVRDERYLQLCKEFANRVLTSADAANSSWPKRYLHTFDIGKQQYEAVRQTFDGLTKDYKFTRR
jgi:hypothetical protein